MSLRYLHTRINYVIVFGLCRMKNEAQLQLVTWLNTYGYHNNVFFYCNTAGNNLTKFVSILSRWKFLDLKSNHCSKILYGQIVISRAEFNNRHSNFFNIYWNCFYSNANILNLAIHAKFLDQDSNCGHPCKSFESCFKLRDKNFHLGNILSI